MYDLRVICVELACDLRAICEQKQYKNRQGKNLVIRLPVLVFFLGGIGPAPESGERFDWTALASDLIGTLKSA